MRTFLLFLRERYWQSYVCLTDTKHYNYKNSGAGDSDETLRFKHRHPNKQLVAFSVGCRSMGITRPR